LKVLLYSFHRLPDAYPMNSRKSPYKIRLRDERGEEHDRLIFATDEASVRQRAAARAWIALGKSMAEREYGKYEILSCVLASR
jgi:hypothetical protein